MHSRFATNLTPFLLGLALAGCGVMATTADTCTVPTLSEDELWDLEPEGLSASSVLSAQASVPRISRSQLTVLMAQNTHLNVSEAEGAFDALLEGMAGEFKKGHTVWLPGVGTLKVSYSKARVGRNPRTGEVLQIPASSRLSVKVAAALKLELPKANPYAPPVTPPPTPPPAP